MVKKTEVEFKGRIVSSEYDFQTVASDVTGSYQVLYPKSREDLATAIKILQDEKIFIHEKIFVRSGIQVAKKDLEDGTGGIVINLRELSKVTVKEEEVIAEAAATNEMIIEELIEHNLVLPLTDNSLKSIVSNVLRGDTSYLSRSLGPLSNYVSKIWALESNGNSVIFSTNEKESAVEQVSNTIITQIEFKAVSAEGLWMRQKTFPYSGQDHFLKVAQSLFLKTEISEQTDLVLEAYNGLYGIPLISIITLGYSNKNDGKLDDLIGEALADISDEFKVDIVDETFFGTEVLDAMLDSCLGASLDPTIDSEKLHDIIELGEDLNNFLNLYAKDVHRRIAFGDNNEDEIDTDTHLFSRLQLNQNNKLEVTGFVYSSNADIEDSLSTNVGTRSLDSPQIDPALPIALTRSSMRKPIPNFQGDVYEPTDRGYKSRIKQYATSSYPSAQMSPFMIAYPHDENDVTAAVIFAQENNKCIVARSGGHQYSGKSSGGKDTIVLSMDAFTHWEVSDNIVEVGPAIKLTKLAKRFKKKGITVPHGECPYVAIGGHTQTGGYGHLLRNFGLILDHVLSFDIVLGDGSQRTVSRPSSNILLATHEEELNREIFWGVLGGNAGSFGIVTNYKFKAVKDSDFPNSYGFSATIKYKRRLFLSLMKEVQKWTKAVEEGTLPSNLDFMMTVTSARVIPFPLILAELVHSDLEDDADNNTEGKQEVDAIIKAASSGAGFWKRIQKGKKSLSTLSNSFVRRFPGTTIDGREFRYPYKKRVNCTMKGLSDAFVEKLVEIISDVVSTSGVKLIFQMSIGGGAYQNTENRQITSIPHRDYTYCFVFDIFYKRRHEETAIGFQDKMQQIVDDHFNNDQERRVFWGTFGDTDISKQAVRQMYYDDEEQYVRLQQLKKEVDSIDVFHTEMTVQLPSTLPLIA
ncbi:MAG: FAD-binding protein [Chitinophagales bacterium]